ncbi:MAG: methyltransferase [Candidatus Magasanikbacteria bacterium RIFOXYC2_FULL_42_28]|uniref:Methyltransferase n=1 Tax=Candidatus Magasanikbacteria bacterium RIFOXYC2_FULL_42_28 TaxID=1798704 RepID=A0A1F6NXM2_9BACT|nr:MAG: methyltransferase [Candidatus Magasanikbacteria bacterium RIFOXYC2_FULL_42_28]
MLYTEIKQCRICGNTNLLPIINLGNLSLTGVFPGVGEKVESGPLEMVRCAGSASEACGLVQLKHNYDLVKLYGDNYGYRSGLNSSMVDHLGKISAQALELVRPKAGDLVIDIASNDGTLLRSYPVSLGLDLIGIDPTIKKFGKYYSENITAIPDFFSAANIKQLTSKKAKIITSIAMFYDLEHPVDFMKQIEGTLDDEGVWIFEQSYMPSMIKLVSYDTICHEHLEYYAMRQIKWMAERAGLKIIDVIFSDANGGSFRVVAAKNQSVFATKEEVINKIIQDEESAGFWSDKIYEDFVKNILNHRDNLKQMIAEINSSGKKIFGYGASTKGNVILQFCGLTIKDLPCIAEVNEYKFGRLTPGANIPIISEKQAKELKPDYFLVLPWHFRINIINREKNYLANGGHLFFPLPKPEII